MARRREYGTGSVYRRASDGVWIGTLEAGYTVTGARRRITVSGKTEAVVKRRLRDKRLQVERDGLPSTGARTTVKAWAETWLAQKEATLRPKAYNAAASAVHRWVVPTIGHRRLEDLTPADVRAVATAIRKAGRKSSTALTTHRTLVNMLKAAMVEGHQVPSRVLLVRAPTASVSDRDAVPTFDAVAILRVAATLPHGTRWVAAVLCGMRQAECLGLTWDSVDLDADRIVVQWQLQSLPYRDRANKALGFRVPDSYECRHLVDSWHLTRPKSRKGWRVVPLPPFLRDALLAWRAVAPPNPWGLVWPTLDGRPANSKSDLEEWHAIQGTACVGHPAGRYYHVHEARHTTATKMQEEGADEHTITTMLGHASIVTSRGYMHTDQASAMAALVRVAELLELGLPDPERRGQLEQGSR